MLLILFPYKFTNFHYDLLELDLLKRKLKIRILIHDLSSIVNKNWNKDFKSEQYTGIKKFTNLENWKKNFNNLKKNKNLIIFSFLDLNSISSLFLHYYLLKSQKKILRIGSPGVCFKKKEIRLNFYQVIDYLKKILFQPIKSFFYIRKIFLNFLMKFFNFKKNIIFYSGKYKDNPSKDKNDKYISFHSFDYSRYLNNRKNLKNKKIKNQLVFLDSAGPYFSDDLKMFGDRFLIDNKKWYSELNKFLFDLEKYYNSKVIIIPHHKNKGIKNPFYDKKFKIDHNNNAALRLIPQSKLVIANTATTAVSYAVASKRPILLIYNNQIFENIKIRFFDLQIMSKKLGTQLINISKKYQNMKHIFKINVSKYEKYKYDYLTSKKIKNKMNYQIIKDLL